MWIIWLVADVLLSATIGSFQFWILPAVWTVLALTLFSRRVQLHVLGPLLRARRPNAIEFDAIATPWENVTTAAGANPQDFVLLIIDADELNAYACGGHLVVTTSFAVRELPSDELAGVLAHELSHHLGLHTVSLTLIHWYSLPILLLARLGFALKNVAHAATEAFVSHSSALTALGRIFAGLLTGFSWALLAVLYASDGVSNLVGHRSEFEADRRTVQLGFGRELAAALTHLISRGGGHRSIGWRQRLAASHPPARTRIARIDAILRHPAGVPKRPTAS